MQWVRNDVGEVPPQGPEVAAQCPVRAQWDVLRPAEPAPPSALDTRRSDAAAATAAEMLHELAVLAPPGAAVLAPQLPDDEVMRRTGPPDALVADTDGGHHPVVATHRRMLTDRRGVPARASTLDRPAVADSVEVVDQVARKSKSQLLQLAHHRRLLEAAGMAASSAWGGVLGAERTIVWYDLEAPIWRTPSASEGTKLRSTMEVYDFEFAFRLDIIAVAERHLDQPSTELLVVPVRTGECGRCPWRDHCRALMEASDDVSLLPYANWRMWSRHRARGVHTVADLAALDRRTAAVLDAGVDVGFLAATIEGVEVERPLCDVVDEEQAARLGEAGVDTVGDVQRLDARVLAYAGAAPRNFAESIDLARARTADAPAHLRRDVSRLDVARGDVEVDLDLENSDDGVYLWGALVTDRSGTGLVSGGYRSFASWHPDPSTTEVEVFEQLAAWLSGLQASVHVAGHTLAVYCYNERAEAGAMQRLAADGEHGWSAWVDDLVGSDEWVDLYTVAVDHLITGAGMGLKHLATLAGFTWDDDDPGGLQSMEWHHLATTHPDPEVRRVNRERILTYNRNDVEATLALREWMERDGPSLPRLESLDPIAAT